MDQCVIFYFVAGHSGTNFKFICTVGQFGLLYNNGCYIYILKILICKVTIIV